MTEEPSVPANRNSRANVGAVVVGILVASLVAGTFIVAGSGGSPPAAPRASAVPSASPDPLLTVSSTPTESPIPKASESGGSALVSDSASAALSAAVPSPAQSLDDAPETLEECRAYLLSIGYDPEDCQDSMTDESGVTESTAPASTTSADVGTSSKHVLTAAEVAECRADRSVLGIRLDRCGKAGAEETVVTRAFVDDRSDGDPDENSVPMRKPGFHVDGDFTSVDDTDPFGVHWRGGDLKLKLVGSNAALWIGIVRTPGEYPKSYRLDLAQDGTHRSTVLPGDYVIMVEPADLTAPLSRYSLTVGPAN